jgi:hypothetical protein
MPRTLIPLDVLPRYGQAGVTLTGVAADATNDHEVENNGNVLLMLENVSGGVLAATIVSVKDAYGRTGDCTLTAAALAGAIPGKSIAGPFMPPNWNVGGGSRMQVDTAAGAGARFYALKMQPV